jgi:hypothetical protein
MVSDIEIVARAYREVVLLVEGDMAGYEVWHRILNAIDRL